MEEICWTYRNILPQYSYYNQHIQYPSVQTYTDGIVLDLFLVILIWCQDTQILNMLMSYDEGEFDIFVSVVNLKESSFMTSLVGECWIQMKVYLFLNYYISFHIDFYNIWTHYNLDISKSTLVKYC